MVLIPGEKVKCFKPGKLFEVCRSLDNIMMTADDNKFVNFYSLQHRYGL